MQHLQKTILITLWLFATVVASAQRNILSQELERVGIEKIVRSAQNFKPFPLLGEREQWKDIPLAIQDAVIQHAVQSINYKWSNLPATLFLDYTRTGTRKSFETLVFERRNVLANLVLAECLENKGRFLDDIVNGIWFINEESFWGLPAHIDDALPDINNPYVDLFAAETASLLSWTHYFLGAKLDSISPIIGQRISYEVDKRILSPVLARTDFWWMGYGSEHVNNWNPWIISNWLTCALIMEKNPEKKKQHIEKSIRCLDVFLNQYPDDGGCDEGTSYWGRAGGSLFDCLYLLYNASGRSFNVFNNQLVKNIGNYLTYMHIDKKYFVNFADGSPVAHISPDVVYNYGKLTDTPSLQRLGAFAARNQKIEDGSGLHENIYHQVISMFLAKEFLSADTEVSSPLVSWLPDLQVFTARDEQSSGKGFFIAGQGGHNNESHNHNDVGNFIVYYDGKPVLIDVGVGTYTQKTFSPQRYDIWTMQSAFHNVPTINGQMQPAGREYAAKDVQFKTSSGQVSFSLDLASAYPKEANIVYWKRNLQYKIKSWIRLTDDYQLSKVDGDTFLVLMTSCPVRSENGKLILAGDGYDFQISYNTKQLTPKVEEIKIDDSRLKESWKEKIYRIKLLVNTPKMKDKIVLNMTSTQK